MPDLFYTRETLSRAETVTNDAASASRPSWRLRLRRAPAWSSSNPEIARMTHAMFTELARVDSSLASGALQNAQCIPSLLTGLLDIHFDGEAGAAFGELRGDLAVRGLEVAFILE